MTKRQEIKLFFAFTVLGLEVSALIIIMIYRIIGLVNVQSQLREENAILSKGGTSVIEEVLQDTETVELLDGSIGLREVEIRFFSSSYFFSAQTEINNNYYNPTENERQWAYLMAYAEAGIEKPFGQTLVINVLINRALRNNSDLITVSLEDGQFSCIHNGVPCIYSDKEDVWFPVTEDMITDELRDAVDSAFEKDYTEDLLKEVAEAKNLSENYYQGGALYFYSPGAVSDYQSNLRANIQVSFRYGGHVFYKVWNK